MTGVKIDVVRQIRQSGETSKEIFGVSAWKIGATTSIEEDRVTRNQSTVDHETLTSWCVPRSVEECDANIADVKYVTTFDEPQ